MPATRNQSPSHALNDNPLDASYILGHALDSFIHMHLAATLFPRICPLLTHFDSRSASALVLSRAPAGVELREGGEEGLPIDLRFRYGRSIPLEPRPIRGGGDGGGVGASGGRREEGG